MNSRSLSRPRLLIGVPVVAVLVTVLLSGTAQGVTTPEQAPKSGGAAAGDFYTPPSPLPDGADGDVIRSEPLDFYLGSQATARRVMYLSRDNHGNRIAVTGAILTPPSRSPTTRDSVRPATTPT